MASLKSLIPDLSKAVGMTPDALYERQRSLVRAGLLSARPGRGPGSGVMATPEAVATLLISVLATDSLSETETQTKIVANLKSNETVCPYTGEKTFSAALTSILASEDTAKRVRWIDVFRAGTKPSARIVYYPRGISKLITISLQISAGRDVPVESDFGYVPASPDVRGSRILRVQATLAQLNTIARMLKETGK